MATGAVGRKRSLSRSGAAGLFTSALSAAHACADGSATRNVEWDHGCARLSAQQNVTDEGSHGRHGCHADDGRDDATARRYSEAC